MEDKINTLIEQAKNSALYACCHYSHFRVGAALLTKNGKIYTGCNIENQGIQSICAERVAFSKALSEGEKEFSAIVVIGKLESDKNYSETLPCGYCRQFMTSFCSSDFKIYTYDDDTQKLSQYTLGELLPHCFSLT